MKFNQNLHPKNGGYLFIESDGSPLRGDSFRSLVARVQDYRKRNGFSLGDPEGEVTQQLCARNPALCSHETPAAKRKKQEVSLKGRLLSWLSRQRQKKQPLDFVDAQLAERRAAICASCPMNQALPEGCSSCRVAVREMREELLGNRKIDRRLYGCIILGHDCAVATHLEEIRTDNPELPAQCWRKVGGAQ